MTLTDELKNMTSYLDHTICSDTSAQLFAIHQQSAVEHKLRLISAHDVQSSPVKTAYGTICKVYPSVVNRRIFSIKNTRDSEVSIQTESLYYSTSEGKELIESSAVLLAVNVKLIGRG